MMVYCSHLLASLLSLVLSQHGCQAWLSTTTTSLPPLPPQAGSSATARRRQQQHHQQQPSSLVFRLYLFVDDNNNNNDNTEISSSSSSSSQLLLLPTNTKFITEDAIWLLPPLLTTMAFLLYTETAKVFHWLVDTLSGHTWTSADGGTYMLTIVRPVLNGPVTLAVSILFGTLVSMTIQTLYTRQTKLHTNLISTIEEVHELQVFVDTFPEPYRSESKICLVQFLEEVFDDLNKDPNQQMTPTINPKQYILQLVQILNRFSNDPNTTCPSYIGEVYSGVHKLKELRIDFIASLQSTFAPAHYINIFILIITLLFVFLLETDQTTIQFLLDFQLSICWALLIGTFSMLSAVIYDLGSPFTGIFSIMERNNVQLEDMKQQCSITNEK